MSRIDHDGIAMPTTTPQVDDACGSGVLMHDRHSMPSPMRRLLLPLAFLAMALSSLRCGGGTEVEVSTCPPAPLDRELLRRSCDFAGSCFYAAPSIGGPDCNSSECACVDNVFQCSTKLVYCPCTLSVCPPEATLGGACTWVTDAGDQPAGQCTRARNAECAVPDLPAGKIDGLVCACDEPGPRWRCTAAP